MSDVERLDVLLKEFLDHEGIKNYDSNLCWGCGEVKTEPCEPDCLLERTRKALAQLQDYSQLAARNPERI